MDRMVVGFFSTFDIIRSRILRLTLSVPLFRRWFCTRADRLFVFFLGVCAVNLFLSILFPLWVLLLGPMIYGIPHILSSIRYTHLALNKTPTSPRPGLRFFTSIFTVILLFRLATDTGFIRLPDFDLLPEWISLVVTFLGAAWIYKERLFTLRNIIYLFCLLGAAWIAPVWMSGALILIHNFIGFFYWIHASQTRRERIVSIAATGVFTAITAMIFLGCFDSVYHSFTPAAEIVWAKMDYSQLGKMIAPWSPNYIVWFHCVVAYAFGQAVHYFVWLKAIPDQRHTHETPTSFRQSYRLLVNDFGKGYLAAFAALSLIPILAWCFVNYPQARVVYFAIASYHGFLELATLSFIFKRAPA